MKKVEVTTSEEIKTSVSSIYDKLAEKRQRIYEQKEEERRKRKEEKEAAKLKEDGTKKTKKEIREERLNKWKTVLEDLTGEDLDYEPPKPSKKKFKKWIGDEELFATKEKSRKKKKKDYNKEFEPELNMLKNIVADQNRFTTDLYKKFQTITKDGVGINKTIVDLAATINASRSNALTALRDIGNIKKSIADLTMKQKKMDGEGTSNFENLDIGLMGSNIANAMFGDESNGRVYGNDEIRMDNGIQNRIDSRNDNIVVSVSQDVPNSSFNQVQDTISHSFDPNSWSGPDLGNSAITYETIPKTIVCEWKQDENKARFKAIDNNTGAEIPNYPVPIISTDKLTFNTKDMTVKGEFDDIYKLEIV